MPQHSSHRFAGRGNLVHHFGGRVSQHPHGANVEDLNAPLFIGGDAREVGAVKDCILQRAGFEQRFFRLLTSRLRVRCYATVLWK